MCSLRWAATTLSRVKSQIYESLIRQSPLGFPGWRVGTSAAAFPKQGTACIWIHVSCWLPHLSLPREERNGDTGGFHFMHWNFIFFPKCVWVWVWVWASLAPLPKEMYPALHFLPKGPSLGIHLRFRDPMVLAVYGLGHHLPESIIPLDKVRHVVTQKVRLKEWNEGKAGMVTNKLCIFVMLHSHSLCLPNAVDLFKL